MRLNKSIRAAKSLRAGGAGGAARPGERLHKDPGEGVWGVDVA